MEVVNPSVMVFRLDLLFSRLCGSWMNISSTPLGFWYFGGIYRAKRQSGGTRGGHVTSQIFNLECWGIYRAKRQWGGHPRWAQPTRARLGLLDRPGGCRTPWSTPRCFLGPLDVFWPKNSWRSFAAFGLRLILISCNVKNKQKKTATGTGHWVNRLVPKNEGNSPRGNNKVIIYFLISW